MTQTPQERIRSLLIRGDNLLKSQGAGGPARTARAREAYAEANELARETELDPRLREVVERRLAALDGEPGDDGGG